MSKQVERLIGDPVTPLPAGLTPDGRILNGRYVMLEPLSVSRHGAALFRSFANSDPEGLIWTYLGYGPFEDENTFLTWLRTKEESRDPLFYAYVPRNAGRASGMGSFMRMDGPNGVIEIGHIWFSPTLQNSREGTEVIFLKMQHAFDDLGVRRLEWKCDALNAPSRRAAERLGFSFEGVFRQHMIVKKRNRDTAWYALIDKDWPAVKRAYQSWLAPSNFDDTGRQHTPLHAKI